MLCDAMLSDVMRCDAMLFFVMWCDFILCDGVASRHVTLYDLMLQSGREAAPVLR